MFGYSTKEERVFVLFKVPITRSKQANKDLLISNLSPIDLFTKIQNNT